MDYAYPFYPFDTRVRFLDTIRAKVVRSFISFALGKNLLPNFHPAVRAGNLYRESHMH